MMTIFSTKKIVLTLLACCFAFIGRAQLGFNYSQYDAGASVGLNQVFGDASTQTTTASVVLNLTYNYTPYTNFVLEGQFGQLKGGNYLKDRSRRQFANNFSAFDFRGQLQLGELIDYSRSPFANFMKNGYISTGVGYIIDQITFIKRDNNYGSFTTPGQNDSNEIFIPIRLGYEIKVFNQYDQPSFKIDLAYQYNMIMGDNLDGYTWGKTNDVLSQITIGVKFAIGGSINSYRKQIQY